MTKWQEELLEKYLRAHPEECVPFELSLEEMIELLHDETSVWNEARDEAFYSLLEKAVDSPIGRTVEQLHLW